MKTRRGEEPISRPKLERSRSRIDVQSREVNRIVDKQSRNSSAEIGTSEEDKQF